MFKQPKVRIDGKISGVSNIDYHNDSDNLASFTVVTGLANVEVYFYNHYTGKWSDSKTKPHSVEII